MTYSTYRKALEEARKSGGKSKVRYILQTSDSSDDEGETLSHVSKKSKKTRSTSESDCRENVPLMHFWQMKLLFGHYKCAYRGTARKYNTSKASK